MKAWQKIDHVRAVNRAKSARYRKRHRARYNRVERERRLRNPQAFHEAQYRFTEKLAWWKCGRKGSWLDDHIQEAGLSIMSREQLQYPLFRVRRSGGGSYLERLFEPLPSFHFTIRKGAEACQ